MDSLLQKLGSDVKGVIEGFDRIVFKGMLRPLLIPGGFASFLNTRSVLNIGLCCEWYSRSAANGIVTEKCLR